MRLRDFLNIGVGKKPFFLNRCKMTWQSIIYLSTTPLKCLFLRENLIFLKIVKNRVYQIAKNPKKWNNTLGFFFGFHSKLVREHNGPKKMDPPCMFLVGYFGTFNLNFDFLKKKYLGHPKMTKIFFLPQSIPFTST